MIDDKLVEALKKLSFEEYVPANDILPKKDGRNRFGLIAPGHLVSHISYPAGTASPQHEHPELRITFIRKGSAVFVCNGTESTIGEGDVITIQPGTKHGFKVLEGPLNITELVI
jgi:quercetin dioxygenase-like cupin family protein